MANLSLLEQLSGSASGWFPILLDVAAKGAVILVLTGILAVSMRRAPAATRHLVWLLGTCSLLILPVLSATLPGWHILPQWMGGTQVAAPAEVVSQRDTGSSAYGGTTAAYVAPREEIPVPAMRPSAPAVAEYPHAPAQPTDSGPWALTRAMSLPWQAWALLAWTGGTLILLAIIAGGNFSLRWLEHRSERITDEDWLSLLSQLCTQLGIHRTVAMLCSAQRTMPMTWGLWRTRILLPSDAESWSLDQRRAVLLHELAHAKRWDCLWQLAVQVTCALYWFNPLVWLSWHRIQTERERACDDLVLRSGTKASAYAEQLLHIAEEMPATRYSAAAIAMARQGTLERRLRAILDSTRNRSRLAITTAITLTIIVGVSAAFLAVLRAEELSNDPALQTVTQWAAQHGWRAQEVAPTTLESRFGGGWRNLPFTLSKDEEADAKACIRLAQGTRSSFNGNTLFSEPATRTALEDILAKRPGYFYAELLLARWHRDYGDGKEATRLLEAAYEHAPVIIVQRFQLPDGSALTNASIQSFALECNRVQKGYLDPSLQLEYIDLRTDAQGCIYLPVYDTVYRTDNMAHPAGYSVDFPRLGWFETSRKVAMLPVATVTSKPGDFAPAGAAGGPATATAILPGDNTVELLAVSPYPDPQNTWWLPDGSPSPRMYQTGAPGTSPWPKDGGRRFVFRFAKPLVDDAHIQFRFSVPSNTQSHYTTVRTQDLDKPYVLFAAFPTNPRVVSMRMGMASGTWKALAGYDPQTQETTGDLPPGFSFKYDPQNNTRITVVHPVSNLQLRMVAMDANNGEHSASMTWFGRTEIGDGAGMRIEDHFQFDNLPIKQMKFLRLESREYQWVEFQNIANEPGRQLAAVVESGTPATTVPVAVRPAQEQGEPTPTATGTPQPEKKGVDLRGQVLDHTGKPVVGALVMLAGRQRLDFTDGKPRANYQGSRATTDADGRFALSGAGETGEHIAVSTPSLNVWLERAGGAGRELTIRLPEPATLTVRYDIEGAEEEASIRVELATWEMPEWKRALSSVQSLRPRNGNGFVAANMTPGIYDIGRVRRVHIGDSWRTYFCDRTTLALAAGQKETVDFVRKSGQRVKGTVTGLQGTGIAGATILIRSPEATGDPRNTDDWRKTLFDAVGCGVDGPFVTSRLSPGRYKAVAEAYKHQPWEDYVTGEPLPALVATAEFVVPETGVAAPIELELKPLATGKATTQPTSRQSIQLPPLVPWHSEALGLRVSCPTGWTDVTREDMNPPPPLRLHLAEPRAWVNGVQTKLELAVVENGTGTKVDLRGKPSPSAIISKFITVDGQPARVTGFRLPGTDEEMRILQMTKGTRSYTATLVFASARREFYSALADAIFDSIRIVDSSATKPATQPIAFREPVLSDLRADKDGVVLAKVRPILAPKLEEYVGVMTETGRTPEGKALGGGTVRVGGRRRDGSWFRREYSVSGTPSTGPVEVSRPNGWPMPTEQDLLAWVRDKVPHSVTIGNRDSSQTWKLDPMTGRWSRETSGRIVGPDTMLTYVFTMAWEFVEPAGPPPMLVAATDHPGLIGLTFPHAITSTTPPQHRVQLDVLWVDPARGYVPVAFKTSAVSRPASLLTTYDTYGKLKDGTPYPTGWSRDLRPLREKEGLEGLNYIQESRLRIEETSPDAAWFEPPAGPAFPAVPTPGGKAATRPLATQPVRTVSYRLTSQTPGRPDETQVIMTKDGRERRAYPDGRVVITNELEGKSLVLDPKHKIATISPYVNHRPDRPIYSVASVEKGFDPGTRPVVSLGKKQIAGRDVEGIQFSSVVETTDGQSIDTPYTVWRDPVTHRPVQVSTPGSGKFYTHEVAADGTVQTFTFQQASNIWSDFVFDAPLDDSLFAIKIPQGYQVKQGTPFHLNRDDTSATRLPARLTQRVIYKMSEAGGKKVFGDNCLDLESGRICPLRKEVVDGPGKKDLHQWLKDNNIDIAFGRVLLGVDLPAAKVDLRSWETMTAAEAQQVLEKTGASGVNMYGHGEFANMAPLEGEGARSAYAFQTRRGAIGVMELRPVADPRPGVMIRYRILTSALGPDRSQ